MTYVTITVFDTTEEYCAFLMTLAKQGYVRTRTALHPANIIRKRNPKTKAHRVGYAIPYELKKGSGWRVTIHNNSAENNGDNRVIYFVKE